MINFTENTPLNDYTLLIPSVSVGNVGQLTNDLLISGLNLKSIGTAYHKAIIPAVGSNPYNPKENICVACELYADKKNKIAILQLRTSIEQKFAEEYFNDLKNFVSEQKFKEVIILASTYAHEQHNIMSGHYRYITSGKDDVFKELNILPMEESENGIYLIYGSGYAVKLHSILSSIIPSSILIKYTSEGDNRPDAYSMLNVIGSILGIKSDLKDVKQPYSWDLVYGGPPPVGIY